MQLLAVGRFDRLIQTKNNTSWELEQTDQLITHIMQVVHGEYVSVSVSKNQIKIPKEVIEIIVYTRSLLYFRKEIYMNKRKIVFLASLTILLSVPSIKPIVYAEGVKAFIGTVGTSGDNITITISSNKDVDQILINSGIGEFLLTPQTEYSDEQLKGNNQVMDMNGDLLVNSEDYDVLKAHIDGGCKDYTAKERCTHCGATDVNDDGVIDNKDLVMLQSHLDGNCQLADCYFHGNRINHKDDPDHADQYIWSFNYTPTIRGTDNMSFKPQSITSTGTRTGDEKDLSVKAEEYKNPEIIRAGAIPNQNKYLINMPVKVYAVTPLETDQVIFKTNSGTYVVDNPESIDYVKAEKTWSKTFDPGIAGNETIKIVGQGRQSGNSFLDSAVPVAFTERIVDPQVMSTSNSVQTHSYTWTTTSTDAEGKVTTTDHTYYWYTITVTAIANTDTEYVVFNTPGGAVTDSSYSVSGNNRIFSTSWDSTNSGESASASAFCYISEKPVIKNKYQVTFDPQSGSQITPITAEYDTLITKPTDPVRYGYSFSGWYKEARCINAFDFNNDTIRGTTTLFAKWTIKDFQVVFDSQGGSACASVMMKYGTTINPPTQPTRSNYTFAGWFRNTSFTEPWNFTTDTVQGDAKLYTKWIPVVYKVTFNTKGGNEIPAISVNYDSTLPTITSPVLTGYSFVGWFKDSGCTQGWNLVGDRVTGPVTLYAKWSINQYQISFDSMGGSAVNAISTNYKTLITLPDPPSRDGFTFVGWYKDFGCTNPWRFDAYPVYEDTKLYAKWKAN